MELAQEAANIGAFERDLLTNELTWSASQEKLYGLRPGRLRREHQDWAKRVHPDDIATVEAAVQQAAQNKTSLNLEFRIIRPNGVERWVASKREFSSTNEGRPRRLLGVNIDITDASARNSTGPQPRSVRAHGGHHPGIFCLSTI